MTPQHCEEEPDGNTTGYERATEPRKRVSQDDDETHHRSAESEPEAEKRPESKDCQTDNDRERSIHTEAKLLLSDAI